jgi:uncharacterized protein (TIGR03067 family)
MAMNVWMFVILLANVPAGGAPDKGATAKELQRMKGSWSVESLNVMGVNVPEADLAKAALRYVIEEKILTIKTSGKADAVSTLEIDPTVDPKFIELTGTKGEEKGETAKGIYKLDGDTLTLAFGDPRPEKFNSEKVVMLVVLKREKPKKVDCDRNNGVRKK